MESSYEEDWKARLTIPAEEMDRILAAEVEAMDFAETGHLFLGYRRLTRGLARAQRTQWAGVAYGAELVAHWQRTIDGYLKRHGGALLG